MTDDTQTIEKPKGNQPRESQLFYVSLRGWISLIVVTTVCVMSYQQLEVKEPLYTLAGLIVGFFFGQSKPKTQQ
jgi:hypothetical protein